MILVDTHAWVWWHASPRQLSRRARRALDEDDAIGVSAMSAWELAMLVAKERLRLDRDVLVWMQQSFAMQKVSLVPVSAEIAVASTRLPAEFHGDPADRLIVATALQLGLDLVTKDKRIRSSGLVTAVW